MTSLVENLLSLARADGGAETTLAPIRVNFLFSQVAGTWKSAMNQALLDFRVEMSRDDLCAGRRARHFTPAIDSA
jgi:signal transduction histidine kinase